VVSVSDWLKVRIFRFESPETQNKKPKIILISKIHFKKFTVNKQRYFTMFTKLNRVLLASGLAIASAAMLSPAVFAQTSTDDDSGIVAADYKAKVTIAWIGVPAVAAILDDTITVGEVVLTNSPLGTVSTTSNTQYRITAQSLNDGSLLGANNGVLLPYTISLVGGEQDLKPLNVNPPNILFPTITELNNNALTFSVPSTTKPAQFDTFSDTLTLTAISDD
jgi:hypothetical protein